MTYLTSLVTWLLAQQQLFGWLLAISLILAMTTLVMCPWWALRLPVDYFCHADLGKPAFVWKGPLSLLLLLLRNLAGVLLIGVGLLLLVLPGQGLLTMLLGLMLMDVPGKHRLAQWMCARGPVLRSLNWIRAKGKRPPLLPPSSCAIKRKM